MRSPRPRINNPSKIDAMISNLLRTQGCFRYTPYTGHPETWIKVTLDDYKNAVFIEDLAKRFPGKYTNKKEVNEAKRELSVPQSRLVFHKEERGIFILLISAVFAVSVLAIIGGVLMTYLGGSGISTVNVLGQLLETQNVGVAAIFIGGIVLLMLGRRIIKMYETVKLK